MLNASLIITTYNWESALELVLKTALQQVIPPQEILIADDGSTEQTRLLIEKMKKNSSVPIYHLWQEDKGFRAGKIRNKAIAQATSPYIIMIDGDMLLHPLFIKDHLHFARKGFFTQGSRVLLSQKATQKALSQQQSSFHFFSSGLINRKNTLHSLFLASLSQHPQKNKVSGIRTCNFAAWKEDLFKVNGFNEDFEGWGREDSELAIRLLNSGVKRQNLKFAGIAYHLWHKENDRSRLECNTKMLEEAIQNKAKWCKNGIQKL